MPLFSYIAKTKNGEPKSGTIEAVDKHDLATILRQEGCILISADNEKKTKRKINFNIPFLDRISLADKIMFTRNLQVMIAAGISLPRALGTLDKQAKSERFKKAIRSVADGITKGNSFSDSLNGYPEIFSELFVSMVKVGEEAGTLEEVLGILTHQMERDHELRGKIKGAMMYPAVILCAMVGIGILMMIMVVPKLAQTFEDLSMELPLTTRLVIGTGNFLSQFWYIALILAIILAFLGRAGFKTKTGRVILDTVFLKTPIISSLTKKTNSAYTVRTLGSLVSSGVSIVRSLEITANILGNTYYKKAVLKAADEVKKGSKLSDVLDPEQKIYPALVIQMMAVGEETGETGNMLQKLAEFYEQEVNRITQNMSSIIEPFLMIIIGAAVGFFAISMIQPMYSMMGAF